MKQWFKRKERVEKKKELELMPMEIKWEDIMPPIEIKYDPPKKYYVGDWEAKPIERYVPVTPRPERQALDDIDVRLKAFKEQLQLKLPTLRMYNTAKFTVGYDLDGVFYDFGASLKQYLCSLDKKYLSLPKPSKWEFWEDWDMDVEEWIQHCHDGADAGFIFTRKGFADNRVLKDIEQIRALKTITGCKVVVITDRHFGSDSSVSHGATKVWLKEVVFPYDDLVFSGDKTAVHTDFFIDDRPSNCQALKDAGCDVIMMDRAWNKYQEPGINRVDSIINFNTYVMEKMYQSPGVNIFRSYN